MCVGYVGGVDVVVDVCFYYVVEGKVVELVD